MPIFGDSDDDEDEDDLLGAFGKKDSTPNKNSGGGDDNNPFAPMGNKKGRVSKKPAPDGKPMSWAETEMASETERASGAIFVAEEVSIIIIY